MTGVKSIHTQVQFESLVQRHTIVNRSHCFAENVCEHQLSQLYFLWTHFVPEGATLHWTPRNGCLLSPPPSSTVLMSFPFLLPPIIHRTLTHVFSPLLMTLLWLLGNSRNQAIYPDREEKFFDSALQEEHWSQGGHMSRKVHWIFLGAMQLSWDGRQAGMCRSNSPAQMSTSPWD